MSQFTDIRDVILGLVGLEGDTAPTVTATASTDVEVSPQISAINYIDTSPIAAAINDLGVKFAPPVDDGLGADPHGQAVDDQAFDFRLVVSLAALGLALYRISNQ